MQYCAVICELNPLHNGHRYILSRAREISGCDKVIALMSGNFVQRAMPAVCDEYTRAACALMCGADAVIELPSVYATASGERFAYGAVNVLNTIDNITHLVMGTESDDYELILKIAQMQADENHNFKHALKSGLAQGLSYARALTKACAESSGEDAEKVFSILTRPNNILAVAYAKAIITTKSSIKFTPTARVGGDISLNMRGKYSSASAIRACDDLMAVKEAMPDVSFAAYTNCLQNHFVRNGEYGALLMHTLREMPSEDLSLIADCAEGFENKLKALALKCSDYDELLSRVSTSRFTRGRIMRIMLHALLGIKSTMQYDGYNIARLLGVRADSMRILSELPNNIIVNKAGEKFIPEKFKVHYEVDKRATSVYSLITHSGGNIFYRKLLTV